MYFFLMLSLIVFQFVLAVLGPRVMVSLSFLTGAMPLALGGEGMLATPFGRMDISAFRLLGLWLASLFVILFHFGRAWEYVVRYRFHSLFLTFCCFSLLWSPSLAYGLRMIAKLSAPFLFLIVTMLVVSSSQQLKRIERLILMGGIFTLLLAFVCKGLGITKSSVGLTLPATSPALFSAYLVVMGILALANVRDGNRANNFALVVSFSLAVLAAFTRITIAAMFISFSVISFLAFRGMPRFFLPATGMIGLPALFLLSDTFKNRMFYGANKITLTSFIGNPFSVLDHLHGSGRFGAWRDVLKNFFEPSPFIGSGIGATQNYYYSNLGGGLGVIHSEYIRLLAEVGLAGLGFFAIAALAYLLRLLKIYREAPRSAAGKYALAAIGGLVAYLIFMATDNAFDYVAAFGNFVFGLIGMSEKAKEIEDSKSDLKQKSGEIRAEPGSLSVRVGGKTSRLYPILGKNHGC